MDTTLYKDFSSRYKKEFYQKLWMLWSLPRLFYWTEGVVFSQTFLIFQTEFKVNAELESTKPISLVLSESRKNVVGEDFATSEYI